MTCSGGSPAGRRGWSTSPPTTRSAGRRSAATCGCWARPAWWRPRSGAGSATTGSSPTALRPVEGLLRELRGPVPGHVLDGLDLEVRRTGRDRRTTGTAAAPTPHPPRRPHETPPPPATARSATARRTSSSEREFRAPIADVWAAVTEPARLERWIGTWSGDPASGSIDFRMTAEAEDAPVETHRILACDPPRRLVTESGGAGDGSVWRLELDLAETDGVTVLTFGQRLDDVDPGRQRRPGLGLLPRPAGRGRGRPRRRRGGVGRLLPGAGRALPRRVLLSHPADDQPVLLVAVLQPHRLRERRRPRRRPRPSSPAAPGASSIDQIASAPPGRRIRRASAEERPARRSGRCSRGPGSSGRCRRRAAPGRTTPASASASATVTSATTGLARSSASIVWPWRDGPVAHPADQRLLDLDDRAPLDPRVGQHPVHREAQPHAARPARRRGSSTRSRAAVASASSLVNSALSITNTPLARSSRKAGPSSSAARRSTSSPRSDSARATSTYSTGKTLARAGGAGRMVPARTGSGSGTAAGDGRPGRLSTRGRRRGSGHRPGGPPAAAAAGSGPGPRQVEVGAIAARRRASPQRRSRSRPGPRRAAAPRAGGS